ncbi:MAG: TFIIB-type zinc ribbon-containing protein [Firmicutes bacterium]|nr:TFIIB-type zinc ribbon-containing protein [Bacillota bacterium]
MIAEQKCPNCGGAIAFDPAIGKMHCPYCESIFDIEQFQTPQPAKPVGMNQRDEAMKAAASPASMPVYVCRSCGAEVVTPSQTTGSLTCPYCSNNIVLTEQFSGALVPDGIIPFRIMPDKLSDEVRSYYKKKMFLPKGFFSRNSIGPVTGVYVPFWIFDCDVTGDIAFSAEKRGATYRRGDTEYTEYERYRLERKVSMSFAGISLDASKKMPNDLMDSVQPYDLSQLQPFDIRYLAGFVADRFDESSQESRQRATERMKNTGANVAMSRATQGFHSVSIISSSLQTVVKRAAYILLPVYLLNLTYEGQPYQFAVNGQSGKVIGKLPYSKLEERKYFWKRFAVGAGIVAAFIGLIAIAG